MGVDRDDVGDWFDRHQDEHARFERIPPAERRHPLPDLCGMLYLYERFGPGPDSPAAAVTATAHDEFFVAWDARRLTEADVIYLMRCGFRHAPRDDSLCRFV